MKMKKYLCCGIAAVTAFCCTACADENSVPEESGVSTAESVENTDGIAVTMTEEMDARYGETLKTYFAAIESHDYDAFLGAYYPPYVSVYSAYLETQGSSMEAVFDTMCHRFDEDGYESWTLTSLNLSYYSYVSEFVTSDGLDDYFEMYVKAGMFDEDFVAACKEDAEDIHDVLFTLYALYDGDEEAVPVVTQGEIIMLINEDGCYLFG